MAFFGPPPTSRLEELKRIVARDPASRQFLALAEEYRRQGKLRDAVITLERGLQVHSSSVAAHVALGKTYQQLERLEDATRAFQNALRIDPENLVAIRQLAEVYAARGESLEALKKLKLYRGLKPGDKDVTEQIERLEKELTAQKSKEFSSPPVSPSLVSAARMAALRQRAGLSPEIDVNAATSPSLRPLAPPPWAEAGPDSAEAFPEASGAAWEPPAGGVSVAEALERELAGIGGAAPPGPEEPVLEAPPSPPEEAPSPSRQVSDERPALYEDASVVETVLPEPAAAADAGPPPPPAEEAPDEGLTRPLKIPANVLLREAGGPPEPIEGFETAPFAEAAEAAPEAILELTGAGRTEPAPSEPPAGASGEAAPVPPAGPAEEEPPTQPLTTETLAELYLAQGYRAEAREAYQTLAALEREPERALLFRAKVEELSRPVALVPPRLAAFARRFPPPEAASPDIAGHLRSLLEHAQGVRVAVLTDMEGLPVVSVGEAEEGPAGTEVLVAELTAFLKNVRRTRDEIGAGSLRSMTVVGDHGAAVVSPVTPDYTLVLRADADAALGEVRWEASRAALGLQAAVR